LESTWGQRDIGAANNYFGVKAQTVHGQIVYGDIDTGIPTNEGAYQKDQQRRHYYCPLSFIFGYESSFRDHGMFLRNNPRYHAAIDAYAKTKDADEFARRLEKAGYATDQHFAEH